MDPRQPVSRRQARDRSLRRHAVVIGVVAVMMAVGWLVRLTPDEQHRLGLEASGRLDTVFTAARAGELTITADATEVAARVHAAVVMVNRAPVVVAVTATTRDCYALWWDADLVRRGRIMDDELPCEPAPVATSNRPIHFERAGPAVDDPTAAYPWDRVLPPPQRLRFFVLPGLIAGVAISLSMLVRMSIELITGEPATGPSRGR